MKKIFYFIIILLAFATNKTVAQNSAAKNSAKSVFTITTFAKDGSILASSHGFFTGQNNEAFAPWKPFVGAQRAVAVDAAGKKHDIEAVCGVNELYNVCKIRVSAAPSTTLPKQRFASASSGAKTWAVTYALNNPKLSQTTVSNVETFSNTYKYYNLQENSSDEYEGCPLINQNGQIIAMLQPSAADNQLHAVDAQFIESLKVDNGLALNDPVLRQTNLLIAFPNDQQKAAVMFMLASQQTDSLTYNRYIEQYLRQFPNAIEGYTQRATRLLNANRFSEVDREMQTALKNVTKKDEAHSTYARLIYQKEIYKSTIPYSSWSFDRALDEAQKAYDISHNPVYQHQQAQIVYAKGDYNDAYQRFMALTKSMPNNGEIYLEAAQCKQQLNAPKEEYMALLDSAVNVSSSEIASAPYILTRGNTHALLGEYRAAVDDYNHYDSIYHGQPQNAEFYYVREQCEMKIKRYQQAMDDINRAILLDNRNPQYWAEKASLHLRFSQYDDAIRSAEVCNKIAADYPDGWLILGIAQLNKKNKTEARKALLKAKELGDTRAETYLGKL